MTESFSSFLYFASAAAFWVCVGGLIASFIKPIKVAGGLTLLAGAWISILLAWVYSISFVYAAWGIVGAIVTGLTGPLGVLIGLGVSWFYFGIAAAGTLSWLIGMGAIAGGRSASLQE